jgi:hypothetical protein
MAGDNVRGKMAECTMSDNNVSGYLTVHSDGSKHLMVINKYPVTSAVVTLKIPGFSGKGTISELTGASGKKGYESKPIDIKEPMQLKLAPYSVTAISIK